MEKQTSQVQTEVQFEELKTFSCQKLREIAVRRNINPRQKKAQLLIALQALNWNDEAESLKSDMNVLTTMTRSKTRSTMQPSSFIPATTVSNQQQEVQPKAQRKRTKKDKRGRKSSTNIVDNKITSLTDTSNSDLFIALRVNTRTNDNQENVLPSALECSSNNTAESSGTMRNMAFSPLKRSSTFTIGDSEELCTVDSDSSLIPGMKRSSTFTKDKELYAVGNDSSLIPRMKRSSTFTKDKGICADGNDSPGMKRSSTFTIDKEFCAVGRDSSHTPLVDRRNTFTMDKENKRESTSNEAAKSKRSIGERILSTSKNIPRFKPSGKSEFSVKKTITKNPITPGLSVGKRKEMPNFKAIHNKLAKNMESCFDYKQRLEKKAQVYNQSPVPRCATKTTSSPKVWPQVETSKDLGSTSKIPVKVHKMQSLLRSNVGISQSNTLTAKNETKPSALKKPVSREELNSFVGNKSRPINIYKKRNQERTYISGVRTNKRFQLQMEMRLKNE